MKNHLTSPGQTDGPMTIRNGNRRPMINLLTDPEQQWTNDNLSWKKATNETSPF